MELLEVRPEVLEKIELMWIDSDYNAHKQGVNSLVDDLSSC